MVADNCQRFFFGKVELINLMSCYGGEGELRSAVGQATPAPARAFVSRLARRGLPRETIMKLFGETRG
jgi:hypothetical protein